MFLLKQPSWQSVESSSVQAVGQLLERGVFLLIQVESLWVSMGELNRKTENKLFQCTFKKFLFLTFLSKTTVL